MFQQIGAGAGQDGVGIVMLHGAAVDIDQRAVGPARVQPDDGPAGRIPAERELDLVPVGQDRRGADFVDFHCGLADAAQGLADQGPLPLPLLDFG